VPLWGGFSGRHHPRWGSSAAFTVPERKPLKAQNRLIDLISLMLKLDQHFEDVHRTILACSAIVPFTLPAR
jgi:hypothetical protein